MDKPEVVAPDSGVAALILIARFHGIPANEKHLRHQAGVKSGAFSEDELVLSGRSLGLKVRKGPGGAATFAKHPFPH